jgi:hypothetical protein
VEGEEGSATVWEGLPPYPMNTGRAAAEARNSGGNPLPFSHAADIAGSLGSLQVGEHEDVEQLGAWSGSEGVATLT